MLECCLDVPPYDPYWASSLLASFCGSLKLYYINYGLVKYQVTISLAFITALLCKALSHIIPHEWEHVSIKHRSKVSFLL